MAFLGLSAAGLLSRADAGAPAAGQREVHPELGRVSWRRGFQAALAESRSSGRPVLVLFDEVPGCSTVRGFGASVLAHPLVAEAVEALFVPVFVQNNAGGEDRAVLERFGEPAWNNPVARFLAADGRALAERFDGPYALAPFVERMRQALVAAGRPVPAYLDLLLEEGRGQTERTYAMHCFWEGEVNLGQVPGVASTEAGFSAGREVVRVKVAPGQERALDEAAQRLGYVPARGEFRPAPSDDKYQIARSALRFVPMTPLQKTRANAALGRPQALARVLSPRQLRVLELAQKGAEMPEVIGIEDVREAWSKTEAVLPAGLASH